jgi:hypothetical protein
MAQGVAAAKSADAAIADVGGQRRVKARRFEAEGLNSVEDALTRTERDGRDVEGELVDHAGDQRLSHGGGFLSGLAASSPLLDADGVVPVDVDDTIVQVYGYAKHSAGFGDCAVRGLNGLLATVSTSTSAPVIVAKRLRQGVAASPRGTSRLVRDARLARQVQLHLPASWPWQQAWTALFAHDHEPATTTTD